MGRPATIAAYIEAAPPEGRTHLRRIHGILREVAPDAQEAMKWNTPFFIEPRFLFAFSAHKAHLSFSPMESGLEPFRKELEAFKTTKGLVRFSYKEALPEDLIRRIAERRLRDVSARQDDSFW
jgi:uncharacterized protein YdhG (YjbR/CyaY superfamily)